MNKTAVARGSKSNVGGTISTGLAVIVGVTAFIGLFGVEPTQAQKIGTGYVRWTEPKEKAFSVEVPQGWNVVGGLVRAGATDVRQSVSVEAPGRVAMVAMGDSGLPTFATLSALDQQMGVREGSSSSVLGNFVQVYLHYMTAQEFNRWYLQNRLSAVVDDIEIGQEQDFPDAARKLQAGALRQIGSGAARTTVRVSASATEFTGISKVTGKKVSALLFTTTQFMGSKNVGEGGTWHANPMVMAVVDDELKTSRQKTTFAAFAHMQSTWKYSAAWNRKESQRVARVTKAAIQKSQVAMRQAQARGGMGGAGGGGGGISGGAGSMSTYWRRNAQRAEQQHQFINYIRDEKDVVTPSGAVVTVPDN